MTSVIIYKKDVERRGRVLLKEVLSFLENEYIIGEFKEMKIQREKLLQSLVYKLINDNKSLESDYVDFKFVHK